MHGSRNEPLTSKDPYIGACMGGILCNAILQPVELLYCTAPYANLTSATLSERHPERLVARSVEAWRA